MPDVAGIYLGFTGKVYYLTTTRTAWPGTLTNGIYSGAAPAGLVEMSCIRSVSDSSAYTEADGSTRASGKFEIVIPAKLKLEFDFEVPWQPADAGFAALRNAYNAGTVIPLAILDGPSTQSGVQGVFADFSVLAFPREEPEDKEMLSKVKVKAGVSLVPPQAVAVS